jgi:hypothetical protein
MSIIQDYLDNAIKANAAYGNFSKEMSPTEYMKELTDPKGEVKLSTDQAKDFAGVTEQRDTAGKVVKIDGKIQYRDEAGKGHEILASSSDYGIGTSTGFDGVLLRNKKTGEVSLNIRGTSSLLDLMASKDLAITGFTSQEGSMNAFYQKAQQEGVISSADKLIVNGHSLGGFLATKFALNHGGMP